VVTLASDMVAMLRTEVGRDPYDEDLAASVSELSVQSEEFRARFLLVDAPQPGTGTDEALRLLASWAAPAGLGATRDPDARAAGAAPSADQRPALGPAEQASVLAQDDG
jgi:hypothetical protein